LIAEPEKDPPEAIVICDGIRYGFELTDIFSVGDTNAGGSEYLQFSRRWRELKKELIEILEHRHANLDQCDIYLRLDRQSENPFDLANLPTLKEYLDTFANASTTSPL
jgi:hypothetical protein